MIRKFTFFILWHSVLFCAKAQVFKAGNTYFGTNNYIEYFAGNAPIIISAPHGGYLQPSYMPDRNCDNCAYVSDAYTQELTRLIQQKFYKKTGCYLHIIYNLVHRKKLDMNRELIMATDSNSALDIYWNEYHKYIDSAKAKITNTYGKGLFIDMHGHGHTKQRIELGYLVSKSTLQLPDSLINLPKYTNFTSIRNLAKNNLNNFSHVAMLRGEKSMGSMFAYKGFPSVPSNVDLFPEANDEYFNGGYNTIRHGSNTVGKIDAIQLELYSAIRFDSTQRKKFADSFVNVMINYLAIHYFINYKINACNATQLVNTTLQNTIQIFPNPVNDMVNILSNVPIQQLRILNTEGKIVLMENNCNNMNISLKNLNNGLYFIYLFTENGSIVRKIVKE